MHISNFSFDLTDLRIEDNDPLKYFVGSGTGQGTEPGVRAGIEPGHERKHGLLATGQGRDRLGVEPGSGQGRGQA